MNRSKMQLFCLGVKRLLCSWFVLKRRAKLGVRLKNEVSRRLLLLRNCIPCEFQRKTRSLCVLTKFKATEFKFILLYCRPVILLHILNVNRIKNSLLLHVACRILCNDNLIAKQQSHAKIYLHRFFLGIGTLYSKIQVMNIHCVFYVADDVLVRFGNGVQFQPNLCFYIRKLSRKVNEPDSYNIPSSSLSPLQTSRIVSNRAFKTKNTFSNKNIGIRRN